MLLLLLNCCHRSFNNSNVFFRPLKRMSRDNSNRDKHKDFACLPERLSKIAKSRQAVSNFCHSEQKVSFAEGEKSFLRAASGGKYAKSNKLLTVRIVTALSVFLAMTSLSLLPKIISSSCYLNLLLFF